MGIPSHIVEATGDTSFLFWGKSARAPMISENRIHQGVQIGDRVFDKLTGPAGLPRKEWEAQVSGINVIFKDL